MKRYFLAVVLSALVLPFLAPATDGFYINSGTVTFPPQVDATNFVNNATITIATTLPYSTSNTENFTNRGSMTGNVGWQLDHAPTGSGLRRAATSLHNHPQGSITASTQFLIGATNLINEGIFTVGELGLMSLKGTNVNLKRGGIQVAPFVGQGTFVNSNSTLFLPETGIIDNYWGANTNFVNTAGILSRFVVGGITNWQAVAPNPFAFTVASPAKTFVNVTTNFLLVTITNSFGGTTNVLLGTNFTVQGAFVGVSGTNIGAQARFTPSSNPSNDFRTITVELAASINNPVTTLDDKLTVYVLDRLTSGTNTGLSTNITVLPRTYRPASYLISRTLPIDYQIGDAPNSTVVANLLYDPQTFSNAFVSTISSAYGFTADKLAATQPAVPGASITNIPGRIEINAGSLNLERTRFRSDGLVTVKGKHLISTTNANMDAFNLNFDLGNTNGQLRIQNLAKSQVTRFGGDVELWSGTWSNTATVIFTNNFAPDTNVPPNYVQSPLTNTINYAFHVLIVDASLILLPTPVTTYNFITRSTNVALADPLLITNIFFTDAQRFTVEGPAGGISLASAAQYWTVGNSPNLRYFTNSGTVSVLNEARFGYDPVLAATALTAFVNRSNLTAAGIYASSTYFENAGFLDSSSILAVDTVSGRMENGSSFTGGDLEVKAQDFKLRNYTNQSGGVMNFTITNSLFDSGSTSPNRLSCGDGFHVQLINGTGKPTIGDLLGTRLETAAPIFASIEHTWPGDDRGVSTAGYTNNLAVGQLVVSVGFLAEAVFNGAGTSNAIYVDYLNLVGITLAQVETALVAAPNLVIYFADSNLPAEQLDGLLGGHLRWVKSYAGAYSSVDLLVNGQVTKVNRALRQSLTLDSDGDGLANGYDASPFDPAVLSLSVASSSPLKLALGWNAAANTVYKLEYTTNNAQSWQFLKNYTNTTATAGPASVLDQVPAGSSQRYYRVGYQP
ncbi:MAG: hypothetical protein D4R57_00085 [Verrucomicrobiales bacterium]|nr:MAG: hypothetical protein D4R57_00085 [Verrucomicrobiales bacterium]